MDTQAKLAKDAPSVVRLAHERRRTPVAGPAYPSDMDTQAKLAKDAPSVVCLAHERRRTPVAGPAYPSDMDTQAKLAKDAPSVVCLAHERGRTPASAGMRVHVVYSALIVTYSWPRSEKKTSVSQPEPGSVSSYSISWPWIEAASADAS